MTTLDHGSVLAQVIAERDIQQLLARFDDAAIRYDRATFRELWMPDGIWEISVPVPLRAEGQDAVVAALDNFHKVNEFFFRSTARPLIQIEGSGARLRSPTVELGRRDGNLVYANVALYLDEVVLDNGRWKFARRYYQYLWVDQKSHLGGEIAGIKALALHE